MYTLYIMPLCTCITRICTVHYRKKSFNTEKIPLDHTTCILHRQYVPLSPDLCILTPVNACINKSQPSSVIVHGLSQQYIATRVLLQERARICQLAI